MKIEKSKPMRELVYEELKRLIIDGEIEAGERIVETDYAQKFQISRTPIREAIRMLELEGFIESQPKGGVIVKEIGKEDIEEIYRIRIALEGIIIDEVIKKVTAKDIEKVCGKPFDECIEILMPGMIEKYPTLHNIIDKRQTEFVKAK